MVALHFYTHLKFNNRIRNLFSLASIACTFTLSCCSSCSVVHLLILATSCFQESSVTKRDLDVIFKEVLFFKQNHFLYSKKKSGLQILFSFIQEITKIPLKKLYEVQESPFLFCRFSVREERKRREPHKGNVKKRKFPRSYQGNNKHGMFEETLKTCIKGLNLKNFVWLIKGLNKIIEKWGL